MDPPVLMKQVGVFFLGLSIQVSSQPATVLHTFLISKDPANSLHRPPYNFTGVVPSNVENAHATFNDLILDRRPSNNDHLDDFGLNGAFGGPSRFPGDFSHPSGSSMPMRTKPGPEVFRHVAPHATHGFKVEPSNSSFQDGYQYGVSAPQSELSLRLPVTAMGVDETLSRMKLQPHSGQGGTDLQSFIRLAPISNLQILRKKSTYKSLIIGLTLNSIWQVRIVLVMGNVPLLSCLAK